MRHLVECQCKDIRARNVFVAFNCCPCLVAKRPIVFCGVATACKVAFANIPTITCAVQQRVETLWNVIKCKLGVSTNVKGSSQLVRNDQLYMCICLKAT